MKLSGDAPLPVQVELSNGKLVKLLRLRGFARVVIAAGPAAEVARAVAAAEPFKQALLDRGVLFVPFATDGGAVPAGESDGDAAGKRWRAGPVYSGEWTAWFDEQTALAKIAKGTPVYVSLRMDGRVRASGAQGHRGPPPLAGLLYWLGTYARRGSRAGNHARYFAPPPLRRRRAPALADPRDGAAPDRGVLRGLPRRRAWPAAPSFTAADVCHAC